MASAHDIKAAERTYSLFVQIMKWSAIVTAALVALVIFLVA